MGSGETFQLATVGLLVTLGTALWGLFKFVSSSTDQVRRDLQGELKEALQEVDKRRDQMRADFLEALRQMETRVSQQAGRNESKLDQVLDKISGMPAFESRLSRIERGG